MKLDLHVHTAFSRSTTIDPLSLVMKASYNTRARARRALLFDLVARPATRLHEAA